MEGLMLAIACGISSDSFITTVFCWVITAAAGWPLDVVEATVSIVRSITRLTDCAIAGGAWSISETVTIPVAMEVTNEHNNPSRIICDLVSFSMSISRIVATMREVSRSRYQVSEKISLRI